MCKYTHSKKYNIIRKSAHSKQKSMFRITVNAQKYASVELINCGDVDRLSDAFSLVLHVPSFSSYYEEI